MKKKISILVIVALIFALLPMTVFATEGVHLKYVKKTMYTGTSLKQVLYDEDGEAISGLTFKSSNSNVLSVSSSGTMKAKKAGTATVTVKYGSKKYSAKITVKKSQVSLNKSSIAFSSDTKKYVKVTYTGNDEISYDVTSGERLIDVHWGKWSGDVIKLYIEPAVSYAGAAKIKVYPTNRPNDYKTITVKLNFPPATQADKDLAEKEAIDQITGEDLSGVVIEVHPENYGGSDIDLDGVN